MLDHLAQQLLTKENCSCSFGFLDKTVEIRFSFEHLLSSLLALVAGFLGN